jgi:hypothetical protein
MMLSALVTATALTGCGNSAKPSITEQNLLSALQRNGFQIVLNLKSGADYKRFASSGGLHKREGDQLSQDRTAGLRDYVVAARGSGIVVASLWATPSDAQNAAHRLTEQVVHEDEAAGYTPRQSKKLAVRVHPVQNVVLQPSAPKAPSDFLARVSAIRKQLARTPGSP